LHQISESPTPEKFKEYAAPAHGIKGSSLNIGADIVGKSATILDAAAKVSDLATIQAGHDEFVKQTESLIAAMQRYLAANP
jgi:hypothetical protein